MATDSVQGRLDTSAPFRGGHMFTTTSLLKKLHQDLIAIKPGISHQERKTQMPSMNMCDVDVGCFDHYVDTIAQYTLCKVVPLEITQFPFQSLV